MAAISSDQIVSILREEITNYDFNQNDEEVGKVVRVGDGIATIYGMNHAMYGEIVVFDSGVKGMVQDIKENQIGCILFGQDSEIHEGSTAVRTHKRAGVPVGEGFIGRIVNALGEPIDGKGEIQSDDYRPVEEPAPSIVDRQSVDTPLATGILSIDSMFPIGRGQRELIIGDRQTGKTSIAIDTILNQKGKDVICVYNAIGQKASTVAKLVHTLDKYGALDYTIVVCSTASDPSSLQYISPYSATAMAEYFMYKGKDCLIVYDDLSKHAVAYPDNKANADKIKYFSPDKEDNCISAPGAEDAYFMTFRNEEGTKCVVRFEATSKMLGICRFYNPSVTVMGKVRF